MELCIVLLVFTSMAVSGQTEILQPAVDSSVCSSNEYHPGADCGLEPSCSPRSASFRPKTTCDCWCRPGLYRDPYTNHCVKKCGIVALCAFAAVAQAGLLAEPHYSSAAAVSSQSIVRHDQPQAIAHKLLAAPVAYHAAPTHVAYHAAPAPVTYHAAPAPVTYHAAPAAIHYSAPIAKVAVAHEEIAHPQYEYSYSVADGHSGDNKSQQESRDGDVVKGSYSFHEADGSIRTVEYTADDHNGFNAVVHNSAATPAPVVVKAAPVYAAPTYYHH